MKECDASAVLDGLGVAKSGVKNIERGIKAGIEPGERRDINGALVIACDKVHRAFDELDDAEDIIEGVCDLICDESSRTMSDAVNHPAHYELPGGMECFDVILASQGAEAAKGFCVGNAIKYLFRAPRKNGAEDHKKAAWYLNKLIELEDSDD